jgi:hypothetical protein
MASSRYLVLALGFILITNELQLTIGCGHVAVCMVRYQMFTADFCISLFVESTDYIKAGGTVVQIVITDF